MEIRNGQRFWLSKEVTGPHEAFCPKQHYANAYQMILPNDVEEIILVCTQCSKDIMENREKFEKEVE